MADFKKLVASAKERIGNAEARTFLARMEAIDAILEGADLQDVKLLAAHVIAEVALECSDQPLADFKDDFLRMVDDFIAMARENEAEDADEAEDVPPQVH